VCALGGSYAEPISTCNGRATRTRRTTRARPASTKPGAAAAERSANRRTMERIGPAEARNRRHPISRPPLKRITIKATTAIRSTVLIGTAWYTLGQMSETAAAASKNSAGAGTGTRSVSFVENTASAKPAVTTRTMPA
jgi:hypothetical protein